MPPERIGSNRGIQYSKKSYPYGHVDSSKIFYIIRDGFSEREAIIEIVSKIWTIRQKILGATPLGQRVLFEYSRSE